MCTIIALENRTIAIAPAVYNAVASVPVLIALYVFCVGSRRSTAAPNRTRVRHYRSVTELAARISSTERIF